MTEDIVENIILNYFPFFFPLFIIVEVIDALDAGVDFVAEALPEGGISGIQHLPQFYSLDFLL